MQCNKQRRGDHVFFYYVNGGFFNLADQALEQHEANTSTPAHRHDATSSTCAEEMKQDKIVKSDGLNMIGRPHPHHPVCGDVDELRPASHEDTRVTHHEHLNSEQCPEPLHVSLEGPTGLWDDLVDIGTTTPTVNLMHARLERPTGPGDDPVDIGTTMHE